MPLPSPGIESQPDLRDLVLGPVDELYFGPDDGVGQGNVALDVEVAIFAVVASAPATASAGPPTAAAARSIGVVPPTLCGDLCPTDTGLETELDGCEGDPADPEIQSD